MANTAADLLGRSLSPFLLPFSLVLHENPLSGFGGHQADYLNIRMTKATKEKGALKDSYIENRDCLEGMKDLEDGTIDMVLADLPYGTTANKWDTIIPLDLLWQQYKRVCKPNAAIVLTAQIPFSITLGASNLAWLRYDWTWVKDYPTGFLNANKMPLKKTEQVLVFYKTLPTYHPQKTLGKPYVKTRKRGSRSTNYREMGEWTTNSKGERYPVSVLTFKRDSSRLHPTQKPVALFEYLIRTYTDEGETILDNVMGSGTTAIAAINSGRKYVGFESDETYYKASLDRITEHTKLKANPDELLEDVA